MTRASLFVVLLFLLCQSTPAQSILKGKLIDDKSNGAIAFARVGLLSQKDSSVLKEQITDSTGAFEMTGILPGNYILLCSAIGYPAFYKEAFLKNQSTVTDLGNLSMTVDPALLGEITVSSSRPAFQSLPGKLIVNVSGNRLFKTATNTLDILRKIPGLEVGGDGSLLMSGRIAPGVFIDGKPVPMSPEELQNYLRSLSPEMIASIEVISNPSSQYDAEYKGIIDIRLKPDLTLGLKGTLTTLLQQNAYIYNENNLLLTYKTKKFVYTTRASYTAGTTIRRYKALQHLGNSDIMATHTKMPTGNNNFNIQLGAAYKINKNHQVEALLRTYQVNRKLGSFNTLFTTDSSAAKNLVFHRGSDNHATPQQDNYAANLNYTAQFGKTQLQVITSFLKINNKQQEDIQNRDLIRDQLDDHWKTNLKNNITIRTAQADVSGSMGKGIWRMGGKFVFTTTKNDLRYDTLTSGNVFERDSSRTNSFQYDEYITAGYIAYERKLGVLNISAGLRAEHTHSVANALTQKEITERNYLTWLPSVGITYVIDKNQQLHLSLSRRITRPVFAQLNPFRFYFSPLNYWVGNPYLLPSKTNTLNISYSRKSFTASFHIGRESDPMTRYPEYDSATNILQYLGRNLPYNDFMGIETSFPITVNKWWRMSHNIGAYNRKEQTPYHGVTYAIPIKTFTISGSQVFSLPKGFTFDLYYYYSSPGGNGLYTGKPISNIDLGLQKTWLKGKLNSKINYYDILNKYQTTLVFREKSIINNRLSHWFGTERVVITLSYNFGRSTYKAKQTGRNEEEARAGM
ncbi:MAG TPA: outer membrane beta-barrel protein [Chitinophagaceae bacterium]|jgi:hypothetical protein|nr:outer membrane beta-barrel protein [Chitinophagaceae bacterium]